MAYIGSRLGWLVSAFGSQIRLDRGRRKGITNLKRLFSEPGAMRKITQAFLDRAEHLVHGLALLSWFITQ